MNQTKIALNQCFVPCGGVRGSFVKDLLHTRKLYYRYLKPFFQIQNNYWEFITHTNLNGYFEPKTGLNDDLKDYKYTNNNKTQIWFGRFNLYSSTARNN